MKVYAHRGFSHKYPEASRAAYEAAIAIGATGLECDIRMTRDGVPICFHDRTAERIAGIKKVISKSSFSELKDLIDPMTLDELLELAIANQRDLLIETKHPVRSGGRVEREVIKRIKQFRSPRLTVMSFSLLATLRLKASYQDVGYVISRSWRALFIPTQLVAVDIDLFQKSSFVRKRLRGKEIFLWTVNNPKLIPQIKQWDIAGVITDRPNLDF